MSTATRPRTRRADLVTGRQPITLDGVDRRITLRWVTPDGRIRLEYVNVAGDGSGARTFDPSDRITLAPKGGRS